MATTALAVQEKAAALELIPKTNRAIILADALKEASEQRALLVQFVARHMVRDVDYGVIPGTKKPSLYKPGAEKLTELYRCTFEPAVTERVQDWEKGFFHYEVRVSLVSRDTGAILGVGMGSCNSRETKYRWRESKRKCPSCQQETIRKSSKEPGFYCWSKIGGCGAKFAEKNPAVVDQPLGRVENPDIADLVNTILKMAMKRAHVAAALQLAGCSDLFTQDVEDLPEELRGGGTELPQVPWEANHPQSNEPPPEYYKGLEQQQAPSEPAAEKPKQPVHPPAQERKPPQRAQQSTAADRKRRAWRVWEWAKKGGMDVPRFRSWCQEALGHSKEQGEWTDADLERLEEAVHRSAQ